MQKHVRLFVDHLETPLGAMTLVADADGRLCAAGWTDGHARMGGLLRAVRAAGGADLRPASNPGGLTAALRAYFAGDWGAIEGLPVAAEGTEFQRAVWTALREIPRGETWSYGQLARRIGRPSAVRAVGLANGANPVAVVVPCHRVIGATGALTGYGAGTKRKHWLLAHEGNVGAGLAPLPGVAASRVGTVSRPTLGVHTS